MPDLHAAVAQLLAEQQKTNRLLLAILSVMTDEGEPEADADAPQYLNGRG